MNISDVMSSEVHTIEPEESIAEAAFRMKETGSDCLVVVEGGKVTGVISLRDMVMGCLLESHISWKCLVLRHMQVHKETIGPDTNVCDAAALMMEKNIDYLPVKDRRKLVGLLTANQASWAVDREMTYMPVA